MKSILLFVLTFFSFLMHGQSKKRIYLNSQSEKITKPEFDAIDSKKFYITTIETDSTVVSMANSYKNIAQLNPTQVNQISMYLEKIIGPTYDKNKSTMIHFYRKNDQNIINDSKHKKYWSWIKTNSNRYQAFLIGAKNSIITENGKLHIFLDDYKLLENLFFSKSEFDVNHILIKPSGQVYIFYGQDDILNILDLSVD